MLTYAGQGDSVTAADAAAEAVELQVLSGSGPYSYSIRMLTYADVC